MVYLSPYSVHVAHMFSKCVVWECGCVDTCKYHVHCTCIRSPTHQLAKYITTLITLLTRLTFSFIKNAQHFVEFTEDIHLHVHVHV